MAIIVAIDGASRKNGKPDCYSMGTVFIYNTSSGTKQFINTAEHESTSQRGELNGLVAALERISTRGDRITSNLIIVSDSEYLFNAVTKEWTKNWMNKGWITAEGTEVKNRDKWEAIHSLLLEIDVKDIEAPIYHIKGHLVNITKAQGRKLIEKNNNYEDLYIRAKELATKLVNDGTDEDYLKALETFEKNHGFLPSNEILVELIACNTVADVVAGYMIDQIGK
ncbi:Ribonuclease H [compost metagenome]